MVGLAAAGRKCCFCPVARDGLCGVAGRLYFRFFCHHPGEDLSARCSVDRNCKQRRSVCDTGRFLEHVVSVGCLCSCINVGFARGDWLDRCRTDCLRPLQPTRHRSEQNRVPQMTEAAEPVQCAEVQSACYWFDTKIDVSRGHAYEMIVIFPPQGARNAVRDSILSIHDLGGWPAWANIIGSVFFFLRRNPFQPWFSLMATVDRKHPQRLRGGLHYCPRASGRLICYFNDSPWAYGNNYGSVLLKVKDLGAIEER